MRGGGGLGHRYVNYYFKKSQHEVLLGSHLEMNLEKPREG